MSAKSPIVLVALAMLAALMAPRGASAQNSSNGPWLGSASAPPSARRRIEIYPRPLLRRQCVDWYELQHRPSGTVLYPQMRCWWVRG